MTRSARAAALRSTALATSLALAVGLSAFAVEASAKPKFHCRSRGRSRATWFRRRTLKPRAAPPRRQESAAAVRAARDAVRAARLAPATRQPAALPPPPRKPSVPAAIAATSSTSQADTEALENVIELVRKRKPADATQAQAAISDPVARKLAEWIILRSDNNGASVERYRAFIVGQSELALADFPAPAPRGGAVGRPSRRRHGLGMVRKRIAALGQGQVLAGAAP